MEKRLTAHLLRTLLSEHFPSKSEMARKLGVEHRAMQKAFQHIEAAKAGTIILDKALFYCAQNGISLDSIICGFKCNYRAERSDNVIGGIQQREAYNHLYVSLPDNLTPEGTEMYESMLRFVRRTSAYICPSCRTWCNPWNGEAHVERSDCYIGHIISVMMTDICTLYTEEGES